MLAPKTHQLGEEVSSAFVEERLSFPSKANLLCVDRSAEHDAGSWPVHQDEGRLVSRVECVSQAVQEGLERGEWGGGEGLEDAAGTGDEDDLVRRLSSLQR